MNVITNEITHGVVLLFENNCIKLSSLNTEYGQGSDVLTGIDKKGEDTEIILDARSILEILAHIGTEYFYIQLMTNKKIMMISPEKENYKYILTALSIEKS